MDIDLVYLWVDGSDPVWQKKKRAFTGTVSDDSETNNIGRYINNDELKYSMRSVVKHAPWIRKIYIVTDGQKPDWLDIHHEKIQLVDHQEIMPQEILPCFNSMVIEYFLYKIPGLSEHFLLANDDMFFNADLSPDYFFAKDGYPIIRLKRKYFGRWSYRWKQLTGKKLGQYRNQVTESALLVDKKFGKYYASIPHHNIDAYKKSDYQKAVEEVFSDQVEKSKLSRTRTYGDLLRSAFGYYALAIKHGHVRYVSREDSLRLLTYKHDFNAYIQRYQPKLFCINDNEKVNNEHRKKIKPFLEEHFPTKAPFEK